MKRVFFISIASALAAAASSAWVYEGEWKCVCNPSDVAVAPNGDVYVICGRTIRHFTPRGSPLGRWGEEGSGNGQFKEPCRLAVAPDLNVYVIDWLNRRVQYFTRTGSFLGKWGSYGHGPGQFWGPKGIAVASNGNVYVADTWNDRVQYFTSSGSFLGEWGSFGSGVGSFWVARDVAVASNGNVYVADSHNYRVQYFTSTGTFLGVWGSRGIGEGEFNSLEGIAVSPDRTIVFTIEGGYYPIHRVQYFSASGSYLGKWGIAGSGNGEFDEPQGISTSPFGARVYVADTGNRRVQYFNRNAPAVTPASLGRVKALFK